MAIPSSPNGTTDSTEGTASLSSEDIQIEMAEIYGGQKTGQLSENHFGVEITSSKIQTNTSTIPPADKSSSWSLGINKMLQGVKNRLRRSWKGTQRDYKALQKILKPSQDEKLQQLLEAFNVSTDHDLDKKFSSQLDALAPLLQSKTPQEQYQHIKSFSKDKQVLLLSRLDASKIDEKYTLNLFEDRLKKLLKDPDMKQLLKDPNFPQEVKKVIENLEFGLNNASLSEWKNYAFSDFVHLHFLAQQKELPTLSKKIERVNQLFYTLEPEMKEALNELEKEFSEKHPGKAILQLGQEKISVEQALKKGLEDDGKSQEVAKALVARHIFPQQDTKSWDINNPKEFLGKYQERLNSLEKNLEHLKICKNELANGKLNKLLDFHTLYLTLGNRLNPSLRMHFQHDNCSFYLFPHEQEVSLEEKIRKALPFTEPGNYCLVPKLSQSLGETKKSELKTQTQLVISEADNQWKESTLLLPEKLSPQDVKLVNKWRDKIKKNRLAISNSFERMEFKNLKINGQELMSACKGEKYEGLKAALNDKSLNNNKKVLVKIALLAEIVQEQLELDESLIAEQLLSAMTIDANPLVPDIQERIDVGMHEIRMKTASSNYGLEEGTVKRLEYDITANTKELTLVNKIPYFCTTEDDGDSHEGVYLPFEQRLELRKIDEEGFIPTTLGLRGVRQAIYPVKV